MSAQIRFQAALVAAATLLCSTAQAQWPQRWHPTGAYADEGQAVAVARDGSVYVAGKTKQFGSHAYWDFVVLKYSAAGVFQWFQSYNGPGEGDDIATSVHVDPSSGNVYVGGTSYGGTSSGFDFCVIAYYSNGQRIWPVSGSAGTGYVYHNGAIRSTSSEDEGAERLDAEHPETANVVQTAMAVREEYSPENRVIALTGLIARVADRKRQYGR